MYTAVSISRFSSDPDESLRIETVSATSLSISTQDPIIDTLRFHLVFDAKTLSQHQKDDPELKTILENSKHPLKLQKFTWDWALLQMSSVASEVSSESFPSTDF